MTLGHLRAGVHVEEADVLAQLPRAGAHGLGDVSRRHRVSDDERDVLLGHGLRPDIRRGSHVVRRRHQRVEVELESTGAERQGVGRDDARVELAGEANDAVTDDEGCRASRMEGAVRCRAHHQVDAEQARHSRCDVDGVRPRRLASGTPPSAGFARTHEHDGEMVRLRGEQRLDGGELGGRRAPLDAWSRRIGDSAGILPVIEQEDAADLAQGDVLHTSGHIAPCRRQESGKQ